MHSARAIFLGTLFFASALSAIDAAEYVIPLFRPDGAAQQGFARIVNESDASGTVRIEGIDDSGKRYGPVTLTLEAKETYHFNSGDLESGNLSKGLSGGLGHGEGDWRLRLTTELDIKPSAYIRTEDGFMTAIHEVVQSAIDEDSSVHHVEIFNPGSNNQQQSRLRVINLTDKSVTVTIDGVDDVGVTPESTVGLTLPAHAARMVTARELEAGGDGLEGRFGKGTGKWQLFVAADSAIAVMSLLQSPSGHLTNLSAAGVEPTTPEGPKRPEEVRNVGTVLDEWLSREGKTVYEAAEDQCKHIIRSHPSYAQCLDDQPNTRHVHMLNVTAADEHMLCILDAFWNGRERDDQTMERLRRFSFAVENSFSNDYRGANSWQGAEGLIDCGELRPDISGDDDTRSSVRTVLDEWLSREGKSVYEAAEDQCNHIIRSHPSYAQCLDDQLNTSHIHMLNVTVADEHMLCILNAFWDERERDEQTTERLRRFSFAVENSFSNDYRGANSWQGAEGLIDCRELRPDFSGG